MLLMENAVLQLDDGLNAGNFKALAAADVRTIRHIILADHIRPEFGEFGAIHFVGARRERILFLANGPA